MLDMNQEEWNPRTCLLPLVSALRVIVAVDRHARFRIPGSQDPADRFSRREMVTDAATISP